MRVKFLKSQKRLFFRPSYTRYSSQLYYEHCCSASYFHPPVLPHPCKLNEPTKVRLVLRSGSTFSEPVMVSFLVSPKTSVFHEPCPSGNLSHMNMQDFRIWSRLSAFERHFGCMAWSRVRKPFCVLAALWYHRISPNLREANVGAERRNG